MPSSSDRERLGHQVSERRKALGLSHAEVRARRGPSSQTMTNIESATGAVPSGSTLRSLDVALEWAEGTSATILAKGPMGDAPAAPVGDVGSMIRGATIDELLTEVRRRMEGGQQDDGNTEAQKKVTALASRRDDDWKAPYGAGQLAADAQDEEPVGLFPPQFGS